MFGFFKKKGEAPEEKAQKLAQNPENAQWKALAAQFEAEERSLLAVTGANGFHGGRTGKEKLWQASIGLTAWMEEDGAEIHQGETGLITLADDQLLSVLRQRARPDFILKFQGRLGLDGKRILLTSLPEPGFDPDLKAILEEQKKPVTFWEDGLGTFTLNRQVDWFETELDWLGTEASLTFDVGESREDCVRNAKAMLASAAEWDRRVREFAAGELTDLANDWAEGEETITREQFAQRLELDSIEVRADGGFQFWFGDGDLFYGHSIRVTGDLENGPEEASMEG